MHPLLPIQGPPRTEGVPEDAEILVLSRAGNWTIFSFEPGSGDSSPYFFTEEDAPFNDVSKAKVHYRLGPAPWAKEFPCARCGKPVERDRLLALFQECSSCTPLHVCDGDDCPACEYEPRS